MKGLSLQFSRVFRSGGARNPILRLAFSESAPSSGAVLAVVWALAPDISLVLSVKAMKQRLGDVQEKKVLLLEA